MLGSLLHYITYTGHKDFHPYDVNFGLFASKEGEKSEERKDRIIKLRAKYSENSFQLLDIKSAAMLYKKH
jgi:folate-dependent tRNA-U54 methylase TrmFO/GidA